MFEKLYSKEIIKKLKKVPIFIWYIIFGLSATLASIYSLVISNPETIQILSDMFAEQITNINVKYILYLSYPITIIIEIIIFEVIAYLVYSIIAKRFFIELSQQDFIFRLRITMIIINTIIGLVSLIYFVLPITANRIITAVLNTSVQNFLLAMFLYAVCKGFIRSGITHKAYLYMARLYLIIVISFTVVNLISIFAQDVIDKVEYVSFIIRLVINVATIVLAHYHYNKLKKIPPKKTEPTEKQSKDDDVVFRDFKF